MALISNIHREVGKITAIMKVRHRAGDTDEQLTVPSRDDKIGMLDHPLKTMDVINRAPFVKSGAQLSADTASLVLNRNMLVKDLPL